MHMPEIGISTAALYPAYLTEDALTKAAELGFPVVEVFLQSHQEYTPAFGIELNKRRAAAGIKVHSLHLHSHYFELWSPYPRMLEEAQQHFLRTLDIANRLEAKALTWHGLRHGLSNPELIGIFLDSVAWAGERAHAAGITLCIENVSWCYLRTSEQVQTFRDLGVPLGFTFDAFQAGESKVDPIELIHAMGDRLITVHLSDYDPAGPRHLPLGEGTLDWRSILNALEDIDYRGPLILELAHVRSLDTLRQSHRFMQEQVALWVDSIYAGTQV
jgi:sugar phosphate isomerase/epimerase